MTAGFNVTIRNQWLDDITAAADAGAGAATAKVYDGTQPATGASVGGSTLLVTLTCGSPFAPAASAGVLSPTLPAAATVAANGTAAWYRVQDGSGTFVYDGTVGSDMTISNTVLVSGDPFTPSSWSISAPNP